ncbi:hypothetical protein EDD52_1311, partial [Primorskyibacter sedentarius]
GYMMASRSKALAHVADFCSATLAGFCSAVDSMAKHIVAISPAVRVNTSSVS